MMKKLCLLFAVAVIALTAKAEDSISSVQVDKPTAIVNQYADENYKLYPTQNMYIFILLDTRNGRLELVQWSTKSSSRTRATLSWQRHIGYSEEEKPGRFELYPTTNMYNFIMVDKVDGRTWQVQWSFEPEDRMVLQIY